MEGGRTRWDKFSHENKATQLCFLPNAGGLEGEQLWGKEGLLGGVRAAMGPAHCRCKGGAYPQCRQANLDVKREGVWLMLRRHYLHKEEEPAVENETRLCHARTTQCTREPSWSSFLACALCLPHAQFHPADFH